MGMKRGQEEQKEWMKRGNVHSSVPHLTPIREGQKNSKSPPGGPVNN